MGTHAEGNEVAKKEGLRKDGYLQCTAMRNMSGQKYVSDRKKPPQLTTVELLHKLCSRGPAGCNERCESFDACLFGQEVNKRGLKSR